MIQLQKATTITATDREGTNKTTNERTSYLIQCANVVPERFGSVLGFRLRYGGVQGSEGTGQRGGRRLERDHAAILRLALGGSAKETKWESVQKTPCWCRFGWSNYSTQTGTNTPKHVLRICICY